MSNNNNADRFADDNSQIDPTVPDNPIKASFLCPLHIWHAPIQGHYVTQQERIDKKLEQCCSAGRKGGQVRSKRWAPVREFAMNMARQRSETSIGKIAYAIANDVVAHAYTRGIDMSHSNAFRTISRWLNDDKKARQR